MDYSKQSINDRYVKLGTISKLNNKRFAFREVKLEYNSNNKELYGGKL